MNKTTKYAINGALWLSIINAILNAIRQAGEIQENPNQEFSWKRLLTAAGKGAVVGGLGGFAIGSIADYQNEQVKPVNTDFALLSLTNRVRLDKAHPKFVKLDEHAVQLANMLACEYGNLIHSMPRLGSTENGTALKEKFDIDFGVNFRPNSFRSTEEMFLSVLRFLCKQKGKASIIRIRDQKKSIGVFVLVNGVEHKIDIVPCKLTAGAQGSGYLYVNDNSIFGRPSYTKTNIRLLRSIKLSATQQKLAIVLKKWKAKYNLPMSSYLLQNLILDAYEYSNKKPSSFTEKVVMVLEHIAKKMDIAVIRGKENTNNILTGIPESDKSAIIAAARETLAEYKYQPNSILKIIS